MLLYLLACAAPDPELPLLGTCTPLGSVYCDRSAATCSGPLDSWYQTDDRRWVCASREDCDAAFDRFFAAACPELAES